MEIIKKYEPTVKQMTYSCFETEANYTLNMTTEQHNEAILQDFYKAIDYVLNMNFQEIREIQSNTISPATQNAFLPLRIYRVLRNGHYKTLKIGTKFLGGFWITEETF